MLSSHAAPRQLSNTHPHPFQQELADRVCPLAASGDATPLLLQELAAGGDNATLATAVLTTYGACTNDQDRQDAYSGVINAPATNDPGTLMKWAPCLP